MKSMLRRFEPVELSAEEMEESLIYVCYDRVIYHFFKRNLGIRNFSWLFSDRYWGFHYSEANEPVQPVHNGLASIVDALGEHVSVSPSKLGEAIRPRLADGWKASAMVRFERPDGSSHYTSTLIEGMDNDIVFYTKTNETSSRACLPLPLEEFAERLARNEDTTVSLQFLQASPALLNSLQGEGVALYQRIHQLLYNHGEPRTLTTDGLDDLLADIDKRRQELLTPPLSKRDQLRMHKHVANKIEPLLWAWSSIASDPECAARLGDHRSHALFAAINSIAIRLKAVLKWTSLICSRPRPGFLDSYVQEFSELIREFSVLQNLAAEADKLLLSSAAAGVQAMMIGEESHEQ